MLPRLEADHIAAQCPDIKHIVIYPEYPGGGTGQHPLMKMRGLLELLHLGEGRLAADHDGYENRWGYRGPKLSQVLGREVAERLELVDDLRMVKSPAEVALTEEACRWGDHAHQLMQDAIRGGCKRTPSIARSKFTGDARPADSVGGAVRAEITRRDACTGDVYFGR